MVVYQRFPNSHGRPDCLLSANYIAHSGVMEVDECPSGVLLSGPLFQIKVGSSLYNVTDYGAYPHTIWTVEGDVEGTADMGHVSGTKVYLEYTEAAIESIRARTFVTVQDETANGFPNSTPIDSLTLSGFESAYHRDLSDIDPNQHHPQFHDHSSDLDGTTLAPNIVLVQQQFSLSGFILAPLITADQNNYQPDGGDDATVWFLQSDATRSLTGLAITETMGFVHLLCNKGTHDIVLKHENTNSLPDHRFFLKNGADLTISPNGSEFIWYDADQFRVRVLG